MCAVSQAVVLFDLRALFAAVDALSGEPAVRHDYRKARMFRTTASSLTSLLTLVSIAGTTLAQPCEPQAKLLGSSPTAEDAFGAGVSMSFGGPNNRPLLAVGKPGEDSPAGVDSGGWSVLELNPSGNWVVTNDSWNATGQAGERAGQSIGLSDPWMIVGAPEWTDRGRVRILRRQTGSNTWLVDQDINPGHIPGSTLARYGACVAISAQEGGWAIVGAPSFSKDFPDSGAVYLYYYNTMTNEWLNSIATEGPTPFGRALGRRGYSVAMSQSSPHAAMGAPGETNDISYPDNGMVYTITRTAGQWTALFPPVDEAGQRFGNALAVEGTWLAVGAEDEDGSPQETGLPATLLNSGAVFLYERVGDGWIHRGTLRSPAPVNGGAFGNALAMSDTQLVVHEHGTNRVYVYARTGTTWNLQSSFQDPENSADYGYGQDLAIRGGEIAVADFYDDHSSVVNPGAVYTMTVSPTHVSGDLCSNPLPMPTGNFVGCTLTATPSIGSVTTCGLGGGGQGSDVWFRFSPTCTGNATIDTFGSDFDTVLSVHTDCPDASGNYSIACNDDAGFSAPNQRVSLVTFNFTAGHSYLVRVSGYNGASGQFTLRPLLLYGVSNDECSGAPTVAVGTHTFNNCSATTTPSSVSLGSDHDIWYRFIAPAAGQYSFDTCGSSFDTVVTVFAGSQTLCQQQLLAQNDDSFNFCGSSGTSLQSMVSLAMTQGQSVMIRVGGVGTTAFGAGQLQVSPVATCPCDFNANGTLSVQDLFDFLSAWFAGNSAADFNGQTGVSVQDIFDFLSCWFGGCN